MTMGGGGSIDAMNKTIQRNRAMLNKRSIFENSDHRRYKGSGIESDKRECVDDSILNEIRNKVRTQQRQKFVKGIIVLMLVMVALSIAIYILLNSTPPHALFVTF